MITIVDYRAGNLASVKRAFEHLGCTVLIADQPAAVRDATHLVVPGVGHFAVTRHLQESGLRSAVESAITAGACLLGICVGMQWLFETSAEAPDLCGLGLFHGKVSKFPSAVKSPHVGWNSIAPAGNSRLFAGVPSGSFVYFTHSYRAPLVAETAAASEYGGEFAAAVEHGRFFGVQFHPEKSGAVGLRILDNFARMKSARGNSAC